MAEEEQDTTEQDNTEQDETGEGNEPEMFEVGDEKFSREDLEGLVADGKFKREVEEKTSTKLDRVFPEYTKATQRVKVLEDPEALAKHYKEKFGKDIAGEKVEQGGEQEFTNEQIEAALGHLEKIGGLTKRNIGEAIAPIIDARFDVKSAAKDLIGKCLKFEEEISGEDGRPAFVAKEVLDHIIEFGFRTPMAAYKDLHEDKLDAWKTKQLSEKTPKAPKIEAGGSRGSKEPKPVKAKREDLGKNIDEALEESRSSRT